MGGTRLVVVAPVRAAEALVGAFHDGRGLPAHVTLVAPQEVEGLEAALHGWRRALEGAASFAVRFTALGWFGSSVLYLAPEDAGPLDALASRVRPAGSAGEFRAHLTLATGRDHPDWAAVEAAGRAALPLRASVEAVTVYRWRTPRWRILDTTALT